MDAVSRRRFLAASLASLGSAGCLSDASTTRYRLSASNWPGALQDNLRWEPRGPFGTQQVESMNQLVTDGALTTTGFALLGPDDTRFVEHEGAYYQVSVRRSAAVRRERWVLWFDLIEGAPPADAEVFESSLGIGGGIDPGAAYNLSELDARAVEAAAGDVYREGPPLEDPDDVPRGRRGHVFVHRDASDSALLPDPPFTHVAFETNEGTRYASAVAERAEVELQQYDHTATQVASSEAEYADYLDETVLTARFERAALSSAEREILETVTTGGGRYNEELPLSDALESILERLGLAAMATPEESAVAFSEDVYFEYRDSYSRAQLEIFR